MSGKGKCKILKQIRRQIAAENDIEFITSECKFQGECSGTCPKCEAEVRYLEQELQKRRQAGKAVAVAGIAAAMIVSASGCSEFRTGGEPLLPPTQSQEDLVEGEILPGVPVLETTAPTDFTEPLMGEPLPNYSTEDKN
jgi:hypothetical protein